MLQEHMILFFDSPGAPITIRDRFLLIPLYRYYARSHTWFPRYVPQPHPPLGSHSHIYLCYCLYQNSK